MKIKILFISLSMAMACALSAQQMSMKRFVELSMGKTEHKTAIPRFYPIRIDYFGKSLIAQKTPIATAIPKWNPKDLPFFCKIEHNIGRKLPMPFKFRLGSVEYVDWLEGKGTAF